MESRPGSMFQMATDSAMMDTTMRMLIHSMMLKMTAYCGSTSAARFRSGSFYKQSSVSVAESYQSRLHTERTTHNVRFRSHLF